MDETMAASDRISSLPDKILCQILSFLSTKESVATSILSRRWKPLWRSVPVFDFNDHRYYVRNRSYLRHIQSAYSFILSRDMHQPLKKFRLSFSYLCDPVHLNAWLLIASQLRVEHIDFNFTMDHVLRLSYDVFMCQTLVVLKLSNVHLSLKSYSVIDLCRLKTLHLSSVTFSEDKELAKLLYGSPNLEELEVIGLCFKSYVSETKFKRVPKLVRAHIFTHIFPLEVAKNIEFLRINWLDPMCLIPDFQNLTDLRFCSYVNNVFLVLEVLKRCPKLQILYIFKGNFEVFPKGNEGHSKSVPICISLHLKTCTFTNYDGSEGDFRFVGYVMQNAKYLQTMKISTSKDVVGQKKKHEMCKSLSLCTRCSATCKLSFE